jgi:hypothetical protein
LQPCAVVRSYDVAGLPQKFCGSGTLKKFAGRRGVRGLVIGGGPQSISGCRQRRRAGLTHEIGAAATVGHHRESRVVQVPLSPIRKDF